MTDKPQITDLDEAKIAIDAEITDLKWWVDLYSRKVADEQASLARYQTAYWRLSELRERMEPKAPAVRLTAPEPARKVA